MLFIKTLFIELQQEETLIDTYVDSIAKGKSLGREKMQKKLVWLMNMVVCIKQLKFVKMKAKLKDYSIIAPSKNQRV